MLRAQTAPFAQQEFPLDQVHRTNC